MIIGSNSNRVRQRAAIGHWQNPSAALLLAADASASVLRSPVSTCYMHSSTASVAVGLDFSINDVVSVVSVKKETRETPEKRACQSGGWLDACTSTVESVRGSVSRILFRPIHRIDDGGMPA